MAKPIEQHVYLVPQRGEDGSVSWQWIYNGNFGNADAFPAIDVPAGKHDIYFTIVDTQNQIKFAGHDGPEIGQAIWLREKGSQTAKQPGISTGGEFTSVTFSGDNGTQLKLDDKNGKKADFVYQLNFVDSSTGQAVTSIDPEIRNGGGTHGVEWVNYALVGAVAGALLAVFFVRFVMKWQRVSP